MIEALIRLMCTSSASRNVAIKMPPSSVHGLLDLPTELIERIISYIPDTDARLVCLARCCRKLHDLATPQIFSKIELFEKNSRGVELSIQPIQTPQNTFSSQATFDRSLPHPPHQALTDSTMRPDEPAFAASQHSGGLNDALPSASLSVSARMPSVSTAPIHQSGQWSGLRTSSPQTASRKRKAEQLAEGMLRSLPRSALAHLMSWPHMAVLTFVLSQRPNLASHVKELKVKLDESCRAGSSVAHMATKILSDSADGASSRVIDQTWLERMKPELQLWSQTEDESKQWEASLADPAQGEEWYDALLAVLLVHLNELRILDLESCGSDYLSLDSEPSGSSRHYWTAKVLQRIGPADFPASSTPRSALSDIQNLSLRSANRVPFDPIPIDVAFRIAGRMPSLEELHLHNMGTESSKGCPLADLPSTLSTLGLYDCWSRGTAFVHRILSSARSLKNIVVGVNYGKYLRRIEASLSFHWDQALMTHANTLEVLVLQPSGQMPCFDSRDVADMHSFRVTLLGSLHQLKNLSIGARFVEPIMGRKTVDGILQKVDASNLAEEIVSNLISQLPPDLERLEILHWNEWKCYTVPSVLMREKGADRLPNSLKTVIFKMDSEKYTRLEVRQNEVGNCKFVVEDKQTRKAR